jgi:tetratricopeptide (TPR) repeat protein
LAAVHLRVAKIQSELGNEEEKKKAAREAAQLYEALVAKAPNDEAAQAHLIEAYARSDQAAKAVAVGETFDAAHPDCLQIKDQLANAYNALGVIRSQSSDHVGTMRAYENSLRLRQQLCQKDPANAEYEIGLAIALNNIGVALDSLERKADALVLWRHSLDHARKLFARKSRDFSVIRLLYRGLNNSSSAEEALGLFEAALKTNREGLELTQKLMKSDPDVPEHVYFCYEFAAVRAGWLEDRGRSAEALSAYRIAVENSLSPLLHTSTLVNSTTWIYFAIAATRCAELIGKEAKELRPEDRAEQNHFAELAVRHLHRGLDTGYRNPTFLKSGEQLNFLRSRADFKELLKRAEKDSEPQKAESQVAKASNVEHPKGGTLGPNQPATPTTGSGADKLQARGDAAVSRCGLGIVERQLGQWEKAEKSFTEARSQFEAILRDDPKALRYRLELGRAHIALGDVYRDTRRFSDALRSWIKGRDCLLSLLKEVSSQDLLAVEAASLLEPLGNYFAQFIPSEADSALSAAQNTSLGMNPDYLLQHGLNCLMVNDDTGYRRTCEKMLNGFPNKYDWDGSYSSDVAVLCALDSKARIEPTKYLPLAERGAKLARPDWEQYRNGHLALSYYRAGKLDKALDRLDFCDRITTSTVRDCVWGEDGYGVLARAIRALVLHRLGRREDAKRALEQARRGYAILESRVLMRPVEPESFEDIPHTLPNTLTVDLVRIFLREACSEVTGDTFRVDQWNTLRRAWGEANFGRKDRARAELDKVGPIDPKDAGLLAARAFVLSQIGDDERAKADYDAALRINPDQLLACYARGRRALAEGRHAAAAEELVHMLAQLLDSRTPHADRFIIDDRTPHADRFIIDGLLASSDVAFKKAVELRPKDLQLWVARGRYLAWHERWKEAAEAYSRGVEPQPLFFDWVDYGCALVLAGDLDGYRQLCSKLALRMQSADRNKGIPTWVDPVRIALLVATLRPDSGIDPQVMRNWMTTGWGQTRIDYAFQCSAAGMAREREGNFEKAVALFSESLRLTPLWSSRDLNWYGLAIVKGRLGQLDEARHWFSQAEASFGFKLRMAREEPNVPAGYWLCDHLLAQVLSREARALLAPDAVHPPGH